MVLYVVLACSLDPVVICYCYGYLRGLARLGCLDLLGVVSFVLVMLCALISLFGVIGGVFAYVCVEIHFYVR